MGSVALRSSDLLSELEDDHDSEELQHNCHSDFDCNQDDDPIYESDKCDQLSWLEKRIQDRVHRFEPLNISRFGVPNCVTMPHKENIVKEIDNLVREKLLKVMEKLVRPGPIVDKDEKINYIYYS